MQTTAVCMVLVTSPTTSNKVLWTDESKMNLYQSDGKNNVWRKKGSAHDPKHTTSSVKQGGGNVMAWTCMATSEKVSLM